MRRPSGVEVLRLLLGHPGALPGVPVRPLQQLVEQEHRVIDARVQITQLGEPGGHRRDREVAGLGVVATFGFQHAAAWVSPAMADLFTQATFGTPLPSEARTDAVREIYVAAIIGGFALVFGVVLLHEPLTLQLVLALAGVAAGIVLVNRRPG